jgi:serine/threonine-protein kinase
VLPHKAPESAGRPGWLWPVLLLVLVAAGVGAYFALQPKALAKTIATPMGEMVLVPAGEFLFGEAKEKVSLPAFYVDKTEVTNRAYGEFCKETGHGLPPSFPADRPELPVVNVTITDAMAYAQWAHLRLPDEREWEKAASGVDGRSYPWGNQADRSLANVGTDGVQPADSLPGGASRFGALNMVGNVWELVRQTRKPSEHAVQTFNTLLFPPPGPDETWYIIRGVSFIDKSIAPNVISDSTTVPACWRDANIGFRCVKNAP